MTNRGSRGTSNASELYKRFISQDDTVRRGWRVTGSVMLWNTTKEKWLPTFFLRSKALNGGLHQNTLSKYGPKNQTGQNYFGCVWRNSCHVASVDQEKVILAVGIDGSSHPPPVTWNHLRVSLVQNTILKNWINLG